MRALVHRSRTSQELSSPVEVTDTFAFIFYIIRPRTAELVCREQTYFRPISDIPSDI